MNRDCEEQCRKEEQESQQMQDQHGKVNHLNFLSNEGQ